MEKITDYEIIKALKCCSKIHCRGCVFWEMRSAQCVSELLSNTLDLIKRQKAEIERLREYNENLLTANTALSNEILDIKSEAIKKFAERANEKLSYYVEQCGEFVPYGMADIIDNLVKEMTEDGK